MGKRERDLLEAYVAGKITRRVALRRLSLLLGAGSAASLLAACSQRREETPPTGQTAPAPVATFTPPGTRADDPELSIEELRYPGNSGEVIAALAKPRRPGPFPAVVLIHENTGLNEHIRDVGRRLAKDGFLTLAPDLASTAGGTRALGDPPRVTEVLNSRSDAEMVGDLRGAVKALQGRSEVKPGVLASFGFCMGGKFSLLLASSEPSLKACVVFYGSLRAREINERIPRNPMDVAMEQLSVPLLGIFGENDQSIKVEDAQQMRTALQGRGVEAEIKTYPAGHAFHNDTRPNYHEPSAVDAYRTAVSYLRRKLA